ncbi:retinol dehydrogenase 11-like [Chrysoperla carnea]|uniref:retinol dehydrogenase 11-like n=1 Tax=Chrysoperla carnea TaxID=189513 RepID=UPI001D081C5C|nr:retinol dehydrogenase 11-like [Chrysoperla carnea]
MAARGARVILGCRNLKSAENIKEEIIGKTGNTDIVIYPLDFESLSSVRKFSKLVHDNESRLDILINNAGAGGLGNKTTEDGLHIGMQVNHFGPFLLTNLLLDLLKQSAPSRIVTVASLMHVTSWLDPNNLNKSLNDIINYSNSKLCNILMSNELAEKLRGTDVISNSLHPGSVRTQLFRNVRWYTPKEGAQTTIHCAVCEKVDGVTGKYYQDCKQQWTSIPARNKRLSAKVWDESVKLVKLQKHEIHY